MSDQGSRGAVRRLAGGTAVRLAAILLPAALLLPAAPVRAELCSVDAVPAATVLLPYFEVDLEDPRGATTLLSLNNALAQPVVARVTLWTDLAVPTWAFDVYLTGYDVQSLNLRDLFAGRSPVTGAAVGPHGRFSDPFSPFEGCFEIAPAVPVAHLRAAHRGGPSPRFGHQCAGLDHGDGRARGYLTADVVGECGSGLFPSDPGYFGDGGIARFDNALWGDFYQVDPAGDLAYGDNLVRLEAAAAAFGPGDRTFYGRYLGDSGADAREPLPGTWALRQIAGGPFAARTRFVGWRETPGPPVPFPCGETPPWFPLGHAWFVTFDEEENGYDPYLLPISPPPAPFLPAAAQSGEGSFVEPFGWIHAGLDRSLLEPAQAFVTAALSAEGRYSVASPATPLESGCDPPGCPAGGAAPPTRLCVSGTALHDRTLDPGDPVLVRAIAGGCYSASCVGGGAAECAVRAAGDGGALELAALICLVPHSEACLPVCDLEPSVGCDSPPLAAGDYTLRHGGLELSFTVPSTVPAGGLCTGGEVSAP